MKTIFLALVKKVVNWLSGASSSDLEHVVNLVKQAAAITTLSGSERKNWVVEQLKEAWKDKNTEGSTINFLIETAVKLVNKK